MYTVQYLGKSAGKFPWCVFYHDAPLARFAIEAHAREWAGDESESLRRLAQEKAEILAKYAKPIPRHIAPR